jgi:hypothetical protein
MSSICKTTERMEGLTLITWLTNFKENLKNTEERSGGLSKIISRKVINLSSWFYIDVKSLAYA